MFGENDTDYWAISIHALREEGDATSRMLEAKQAPNFYPRPP